MGTLLPIPLPLADLLDPARGARPLETTPERDAGRARRSWNLETLSGGLAEISGPRSAAGLTAAAILIRTAQDRGEPAAWIAAGNSLFHAPDLHAWGIDLRALPIVRVRGAVAGARAAEHLLRSGAFGLAVLDLGEGAFTLPSAAQVRLAALCRRHHAALLLLARRPEGAPPAASMAVLRAEGVAERAGSDRFRIRLRILKDKRQAAGWSQEEALRGPDGLC